MVAKRCGRGVSTEHGWQGEGQSQGAATQGHTRQPARAVTGTDGFRGGAGLGAHAVGVPRLGVEKRVGHGFGTHRGAGMGNARALIVNESSVACACQSLPACLTGLTECWALTTGAEGA